MPFWSQFFSLYFEPACCFKECLTSSLFLKFSLVSTRYKITVEPNSKSPQEEEELGGCRRDWLNETQRGEKKWFFSRLFFHPLSALSPPLALPSSSREPLWPAFTCCGRLGAPSPMGAVGSWPLMKCLCSSLRSAVAIETLVSLFVHNKLHQLKREPESDEEADKQDRVGWAARRKEEDKSKNVVRRTVLVAWELGGARTTHAGGHPV